MNTLKLRAMLGMLEAAIAHKDTKSANRYLAVIGEEMNKLAFFIANGMAEKKNDE